MGAKTGYLKSAENDFLYFEDDYERRHFGNPFCYCAQNTCERYLKFLIDEYCSNCDTTEVLKTHSLRKLINFIKNELPDFQCDWRMVLKAEGFYFNARYPGDDYIEVTSEDCEDCWEAVTVTRTAVLEYHSEHSESSNQKSVTVSEQITQLLQSFDDEESN